MKRKLVKQGTSTLMISLPSKWIKQNNLDKGSEIDIEEKDGHLELCTDAKPQKKELTLDVTGYNNTALRSVLTNSYRLSYDKINITYSSEAEFLAISQTLKNSLIGFEIVDKTQNKCVIENITEPSIGHSDTVFLRVLYNISELYDALYRQLKGENEWAYIQEIENNIQRFDNFCRRNAMQNPNATLLVAFYKEIVQSQREIYLIAEYTNKKSIKVSKEVLGLFETSKSMFNKLKDAYQKSDLTSIEEMHSQEKETIYTKGYSLLKTKKGEENIILFRILTSIRMLYLSISPFIGIVLIKSEKL